MRHDASLEDVDYQAARQRNVSFFLGAATQSASGTRLRFVYKPVIAFHFTLNPEDRVVGVTPSWIKGIQVSLDTTNILNLRPMVRDQAGETPLDYQRGYLDPIGRSIKVSLRKLFQTTTTQPSDARLSGGLASLIRESVLTGSTSQRRRLGTMRYPLVPKYPRRGTRQGKSRVSLLRRVRAPMEQG
jgi:hypothetical protein